MLLYIITQIRNFHQYVRLNKSISMIKILITNWAIEEMLKDELAHLLKQCQKRKHSSKWF